MKLITDTESLARLCSDLGRDEFVTVDTEFMRESTYWPDLCLIQLAGSGVTGLIDPLAPGLDLQPFFDLMSKPDVLKVFHAARQDIEIMVHRAGIVPRPVFDTQIAAMVCGFGDQVGYEAIVRKLAKAQIDKSSRFTDWSRRPLTDKQLAYALADVTHLRVVYEQLKLQLDSTGREHWLREEMDILTNPATYRTEPEDAWRRIKVRLKSKKQLGVLVAVSAWREHEAREKNVPRSRILKDDAISEIAVQMPQTPSGAGRTARASKGLRQFAHRRRHSDGREGRTGSRPEIPARARQRPRRRVGADPGRGRDPEAGPQGRLRTGRHRAEADRQLVGHRGHCRE